MFSKLRNRKTLQYINKKRKITGQQAGKQIKNKYKAHSSLSKSECAENHWIHASFPQLHPKKLILRPIRAIRQGVKDRRGAAAACASLTRL